MRMKLGSGGSAAAMLALGCVLASAESAARARGTTSSRRRQYTTSSSNSISTSNTTRETLVQISSSSSSSAVGGKAEATFAQSSSTMLQWEVNGEALYDTDLVQSKSLATFSAPTAGCEGIKTVDGKTVYACEGGVVDPASSSDTKILYYESADAITSARMRFSMKKSGYYHGSGFTVVMLDSKDTEYRFGIQDDAKPGSKFWFQQANPNLFTATDVLSSDLAGLPDDAYSPTMTVDLQETANTWSIRLNGVTLGRKINTDFVPLVSSPEPWSDVMPASFPISLPSDSETRTIKKVGLQAARTEVYISTGDFPTGITSTKLQWEVNGEALYDTQLTVGTGGTAPSSEDGGQCAGISTVGGKPVYVCEGGIKGSLNSPNYPRYQASSAITSARVIFSMRREGANCGFTVYLQASDNTQYHFAMDNNEYRFWLHQIGGPSGTQQPQFTDVENAVLKHTHPPGSHTPTMELEFEQTGSTWSVRLNGQEAWKDIIPTSIPGSITEIGFKPWTSQVYISSGEWPGTAERLKLQKLAEFVESGFMYMMDNVVAGSSKITDEIALANAVAATQGAAIVAIGESL